MHYILKYDYFNLLLTRNCILIKIMQHKNGHRISRIFCNTTTYLIPYINIGFPRPRSPTNFCDLPYSLYWKHLPRTLFRPKFYSTKTPLYNLDIRVLIFDLNFLYTYCKRRQKTPYLKCITS